MSRLVPFLKDRLGWHECLTPFLYKPLPGNLNWTFTLGSTCALLFAVQAVTGIFLALYYNPSPDHAFQSIDYIMREVALGRILRGLHHWGAAAMVVAVFSHLLANFYYGAYKAPRELTWIAGVILFLLTLGFGFTGYLLPWDQKAYWATVVGTRVPHDIPLVGPFITSLLRGGAEVSGLTLTRFFALHVLVLPALTGILILVHVYLVRLHDLAGRPGVKHEEKTGRFYPEHVFKSALAFLAVFGVVFLLALYVDPPREDIALTPDPTYLPRPEWYYLWLFKLLTFFEGAFELVGTLAIPLGGVLLLFLLPFLSRSPLRAAADRPIALACGVAAVAAVVYLTLMGVADSRPYGRIVVLPDRPLKAAETAGLKVWVDRDCAYCHNILGRGGRREGPDLSNVLAKGRTRDYLVKYIRDPQALKWGTIMPKYDLSEAELDQLSRFVLSLDFKKHSPKVVSRKEILDQKTP